MNSGKLFLSVRLKFLSFSKDDNRRRFPHLRSIMSTPPRRIRRNMVHNKIIAVAMSISFRTMSSHSIAHRSLIRKGFSRSTRFDTQFCIEIPAVQLLLNSIQKTLYRQILDLLMLYDAQTFKS